MKGVGTSYRERSVSAHAPSPFPLPPSILRGPEAQSLMPFPPIRRPLGSPSRGAIGWALDGSQGAESVAPGQQSPPLPPSSSPPPAQPGPLGARVMGHTDRVVPTEANCDPPHAPHLPKAVLSGWEVLLLRCPGQKPAWRRRAELSEVALPSPSPKAPAHTSLSRPPTHTQG